MSDEEKIAECRRQADEARQIAQNISDENARRTITELVDEFERLARERAALRRTVRAAMAAVLSGQQLGELN
jgi:hypothetical protein